MLEWWLFLQLKFGNNVFLVRSLELWLLDPKKTHLSFSKSGWRTNLTCLFDILERTWFSHFQNMNVLSATFQTFLGFPAHSIIINKPYTLLTFS